MSAVANLNAALDTLTPDQQREASSILLGYLWSAADQETQDAALAAMRRHVR